MFTFKLWSSTEVTSKKQLRAYIGVDEQPESDDRRPQLMTLNGMIAHQFDSFVKNFGNTPAIRITHGGNIKYCSEKPMEEWFNSLTPVSNGMLQPSQHSFMPYRFVCSEDVWSDILMGKKKDTGWALYCYGRIIYYDIFGKEHFTRYCFKIDFRNGPNGVPAWDLYPSFNDSDMDIESVM